MMYSVIYINKYSPFLSGNHSRKGGWMFFVVDYAFKKRKKNRIVQCYISEERKKMDGEL